MINTGTSMKTTPPLKKLLLLLCGVSLACVLDLRVRGLELDEDERVSEYHRRRNVWPPRLEEYKPSTFGWQQLMSRRLRQLDSLGDDHSLPFTKFSGYLCTTYAALIAPNFTEYGWAVTKAPDYVMRPLLRTLHDGLAHSFGFQSDPNDYRVVEEEVDEEAELLIFEQENPLHAPLLIRDSELYEWVLHEVQPILEGWVGNDISLVPNNAYGLRVYRNHSKLNMHVDLAETHVISAILHVDHDPISEPWPLVIEDLQGNTHEVSLESGDMLLYESSKLLHGRPRRFDGSWYTGLFLHYYPEGWSYREEGEAEVYYRMPPDWAEGGGGHHHNQDGPNVPPAIEVRDTSLAEPDCGIHEWCAVDEEKSFRWETRDLQLKLGEIWNVGGVRERIPLPNYLVNNDGAEYQCAYDQDDEEEQTDHFDDVDYDQ